MGILWQEDAASFMHRNPFLLCLSQNHPPVPVSASGVIQPLQNGEGASSKPPGEPLLNLSLSFLNISQQFISLYHLTGKEMRLLQDKSNIVAFGRAA